VLLASIGIYGLVGLYGRPKIAARSVSAWPWGARRDDILRMFLRQGGSALCLGVGIVAGLVVFSASTTSMMASFALWGCAPMIRLCF